MTLALALLFSPALDGAWEAAEAAKGEAGRAAADAALAQIEVSADPEASARAAYRRGWLAERFAQPEAAVGHLRRSLKLDPGGRYASRARRLLRALEARPVADRAVWARFERLKRDRGTRPAQVAALLEVATQDETRGALVEWLGHAALAAGDAAGARGRYLEALRLHPARRSAARGALAAADDLAALREVELALTAAGVVRLADEAGDRRLRVYAAWASAVSFAMLLGLFLTRRGWRAFAPATLRVWRPWSAVGFVLYAFIGGGLLAEAFDDGWLAPFAACGAACAVVHLLAAAPRWCEPPPGTGTRVVCGLVAVAATFAACFLVLGVFDRQALIGL